jgi:hypothetical protein
MYARLQEHVALNPSKKGYQAINPNFLLQYLGRKLGPLPGRQRVAHASTHLSCILALIKVNMAGMLVIVKRAGRVMTHKRDRLSESSFPDEPLAGYEAYQEALHQAYNLKQQGELSGARELLERERDQDLPKSPYQEARTEYIFALECRARAELGNHADEQDQRSPLGEAADHYALAAEAAKKARDWALAAQLKSFESAARYGDVPHQFLGAFAASRDALNAWQLLPDTGDTVDLTYEFALAEDVGVKAQFVAETQIAVDALERAAILLCRLRDRHDVDAQQFANDDVYLYWDWALLGQTLGHYRLAFANTLKTRRKGRVLVRPINEGRLQYLIASIANDCAEEGEVSGYSRKRLLNVAESAIHEALELTQARKDRSGYALVLLAEAKWMGLKHITDGRFAKIEEAERIAIGEDDQMLLLGQVEIARGDEYAFQNMTRRSDRKMQLAKEWYEKAERRLTALEALNLARLARRRLDRLANPPQRQHSIRSSKTPRRSLRKRTGPPAKHKIPLN